MPDFPSGTVTFLYTDVEGSTLVLQHLGAAYTTLLTDERGILRDSVRIFHGHEIDSQGDSYFAVFSSALDAFAAVVAAQRQLSAHYWPQGTRVRVRSALHTGQAQPGATGYVGLDVHRAARLCAAAHGGQVLLSQSTKDLVEPDLPQDVSLRDLGEHKLKDLNRPEHIYQAVVDGLESDFSPLRTLDLHPNNLPVQPTPLIGRERERAAIQEMLLRADVRLVTMTGPGGTGKTRLALQAGADVAGDFPDGVYFVDLTPIADDTLVASTVAQTLGVRQTGSGDIEAQLQDWLGQKRLLLILDNFEQVIAAAAHLATWLSACPRVKILVTSREPLHLRAEKQFPVPPLGLPQLRRATTVTGSRTTEAFPATASDLLEYEAIRLFIDRARDVKPDLDLSNTSLQAVAEICARLDGLPLAIELAAARVKTLQPQVMRVRLERLLPLLTGGARDLPARQQTIKDVIGWSYGLLDGDDKTLLRGLSIFAGGWTLEAAEQVCGHDLDKDILERQAMGSDSLSERDVIDLLAELIDKSLVIVEDVGSGPRYHMLETIRQFAYEALVKQGDPARLRKKHLDYFLNLAETAEPELRGPNQAEWFARLEADHDNIRAALKSASNPIADDESAMRLAAAMAFFWELRGYLSEGRERLAAALSSPASQAHTVSRARALAGAGHLAYRQSDYPASKALFEESLLLSRELSFRPGIAVALVGLGNTATEVGDYATAPALFEESLIIRRELEDIRGMANSLLNLGWAAMRPGDYSQAAVRLEEALSLYRSLGDMQGTSMALSGLGEVSVRLQEYGRAVTLQEESLALRREMGMQWGIAVSLGTLGWIALRQNDLPRAAARLRESLLVRSEIGDKGGIAWCLEKLAELELGRGRAERAVTIYGAASSLRESMGSVIDPADRPEYEEKLAAARRLIGDANFDLSWARGRAMEIELAVQEGLKAEVST